MQRWKFLLMYEGTDFKGWQKQPDERTVQGELEHALETLYQQSVVTMGQGRTDAGVHAEGQVAHADLPEKFDAKRILHAMKGLLPSDMAMVEAEVISADFHARFDALSRQYRYQITCGKNPLLRRMAWNVESGIDFSLLEKCASDILGKHDFINFCIPPDEPEMTTLSEIFRSEWNRKNGLLIYRIEGNRFLRHLVRRLVGTMVHVGIGKISYERFCEMLNGEESDVKGHTAPAKGLILETVQFKDDELNYG